MPKKSSKEKVFHVKQEENNVNVKPAEKKPIRPYTWCLVAYADEATIRRFCEEQGRNWAYAYHDKDVDEVGQAKEPHTHIVITFECQKSANVVKRLAKAYMPESNTFCEPCLDIGGSLLYLTHESETAKKAGKYQYNREIVKYSSQDFYTKYVKGEEISDNEQFVKDLLCPDEEFSVIKMAKRYGRDFIKNVYSYLRFRDLAEAERQGTNPIFYYYKQTGGIEL